MSPIPQTPLGWDELWEEASPEAEIKGAGAKAPECTIAAARRVGQKTKCLVSVLTERNKQHQKRPIILNSEIYVQRGSTDAR